MAGWLGSKHTADAPVFSRYLADKLWYFNQIDLYIEIPLSVLKESCPQGVRNVSAEAYGERGGGREASGAVYLLTSSSPPVTSLTI